MEWRPGPKAGGYELDGTTRKVVSGTMLSAAETTIIGYACACPEPTSPTRPSVVLDPFGGTGTTALVAKVLGRHGISVDMSADYNRLAEWRTSDPGQIEKVLRRIEKAKNGTVPPKKRTSKTATKKPKASLEPPTVSQLAMDDWWLRRLGLGVRTDSEDDD
jgi:hypothetical protein